MVLVGYDTSNLVALYSDSLLCQGCCADVCSFCENAGKETPYSVNLRLTGAEVCDCTEQSPGRPYASCITEQNQWANLIGDFGALLNGDHALTQRESNACQWRKSFTEEELEGLSIKVYDFDDPCASGCCDGTPCFDEDIIAGSLNVQRTSISGTVGQAINIFVLLTTAEGTFSAMRLIFDLDTINTCINGSGLMRLNECGVNANPDSSFHQYELITVDEFIVWSDLECGGDEWQNGAEYVAGKRIFEDPDCYNCKLAHTSNSTNEPGVGANWETYWTLI